MNVVSLVGRLATAVELREVGADRRLATFVLAVDRPGPDPAADFVRVAAWDRQADRCGAELAKGALVGLDGRLRSRAWSDGEGRRRTALEVVANRIEVL